MPAPCPLYHAGLAQIDARVPAGVPGASRARLARLVAGVAAAQSCVLARVARELDHLGLTAASCPEHVGRGLRRALNDPHLAPAACYLPAAAAAVDWAASDEAPIVLILDESSHTEHVHLLRLALAYRGGALPLAWAIWPQNAPQPDGAYAARLGAVLEEAAAALPPGAPVVVVADRAYAVPTVVDALAARGWDWVIRVPTTGRHRLLEADGREAALADRVAAALPGPGSRWRAAGRVFKKAGWRAAHLVGVWARGCAEPLVVLTSLPPRWRVLRLYERRFWIEAGFRADKARGWGWEQSQVRDLAHQAVLLLALAWATLLALCLGAERAAGALAALARPRTRRPPRPQHARRSLCSLGLDRLRAWLYRPAPPPAWRLPERDGPSWADQWWGAQARLRLFALPVRP